MRRSLRTPVLAVTLLLAVTPSSVSAQRRSAASHATDPVQFVVGTYARAGRSTLGTLWGWHTSSSSDVSSLNLRNIAIHGPSGWHNGNSLHGCAVFNGAAPTICIGWRGTPVLPGSYTAQGSAGSWTATAVTSRSIATPRLTKATAIGTTVTVAWKALRGARSYIVGVTPSASSTCCDLANQVVSAATTSHVFKDVPITPGRKYRIGVFALSVNITKDVDLTQPFEIGERRVTVKAQTTFTKKAPKKKTPPAKRMKAQVHGSALVGSSTTKIVDLRVQGLPRKTTVVFRCIRGCNARESLIGGGVVHSQILHDLTVPNGSIIEVRATKSGYTGFYDRLVIHPTSLGFFTEKRMCLPPKGRKPHVCKNGH